MISLILKLVLTIALDVLLLSPLSFSFKLGVQGVAYSSLLTSLATFLLYLSMPLLVTAMAQDSELFDQTVSYVR